MGISIWQIVLVLVLIILLFGRNKISDLMGDVARGITSFKKGLKEDEDDKDTAEPPREISGEASVTEKTREEEKEKN